MKVILIEAKELYDLRHELLRPNLPFEDIIYDTDQIEGSFHVGAYDGNRLISIASFNEDKLEGLNSSYQYRLRAMATHPDYRKKGIGKKIVEFAMRILMEKGSDVLWCKGRTSVQGYYEKIGFTPLGDVFDYPTLGPHIILYKAVEGAK